MTARLIKPGAEVMLEDPLVIKNVKDYFHIHSYGGLTPFFKGLQAGKLMATRCANPDCEENRLWLPPRTHCPDCLAAMEWEEAPTTGTIFTHTTIEYPGEFFRLAAPVPLISVEIEGVGTRMMSYLRTGTPEIGMRVKAWFRTDEPTNTILDLAWEPA